MLEVYVDDYLHLAQAKDPAVLRHCTRALLHGIHSVFPPPAVSGHSGGDPVSLKKLKAGEGLWETRKEILGWMLDGATRCIELAEKKQEAIPREVRRLLRIKNGVAFNDLERVVGKLRHAAIGIPEGKGLMGPINQFMAIKPKRVFWNRCPEVSKALKD